MKTEKRVGRFLEFEADLDPKLSNSFLLLGGFSATPAVRSFLKKLILRYSFTPLGLSNRPHRGGVVRRTLGNIRG